MMKNAKKRTHGFGVFLRCGPYRRRKQRISYEPASEKNELIRPAAANIDRLLIVVAASRPEPDLLLADKLLVCCEKLKIDPVMVINKCDEDAEGSAERIAAEYERTGYRIHRVSAAGGWGIAELKAELEDAAVCLAGQSAVGKSSLLNALLPGIALKVGSLSEKTERGRHTTRHTELIPVGNSGAVLDTPGFSLLDNIEIEPREIKIAIRSSAPCAGNAGLTAASMFPNPAVPSKKAAKTS